MPENLVAELPILQRLALAYAPRAARPRTLALLALDARLVNIIRRGSEPVLAQMRLAWWRDVLAKPVDEWPKGDAVLAALREWRQPDSLGALVDGWEWLLADPFDRQAIEKFAAGRGESFAALAHELDLPEAGAAARRAGTVWALGDLAANLGSEEERRAVLEAYAPERRKPLPRPLRPAAVLGGLARRALARGGAPLLDGPMAGLTALRLGIAGR